MKYTATITFEDGVLSFNGDDRDVQIIMKMYREEIENARIEGQNSEKLRLANKIIDNLTK